jgi:hypothetical protein
VVSFIHPCVNPVPYITFVATPLSAVGYNLKFSQLCAQLINLICRNVARFAAHDYFNAIFIALATAPQNLSQFKHIISYKV